MLEIKCLKCNKYYPDIELNCPYCRWGGMKKGMRVGAIVVSVVLLGGYVVASPYLTINDIKTSAQDRDQEKMAENINLPILRENFKRQLSDQIIESNAAEMRDNNYAAIEAIGLANKMSYVLIDAYITPDGLTSMMSGQYPAQDGAAVNQQKTEDKKVSKAAKYSFDGTSSFSAWMKTDDDEDVRLVLTRNGLSWKLTNIVLPLQCDACHENRFNKGKRV